MGVVVVDERPAFPGGSGQGAELRVEDGRTASLVERAPGALDAQVARLRSEADPPPVV